MAKKKVKKTEKKEKKEVCTSETEVARLDKQIEDLTDLVLKAAISITETNNRIDRIVAALDKSKSVRGL